ncbi:hypothetical protein BGZ50_002075 [Haplosporangium sp. Z 11]|nr:hypothetical protein BGZ50_002075 [Haplosporangium sp. Z 11]
MELLPYNIENIVNDSTFQVHRPYLGSLNINRSVEYSEGFTQHMSRSIISYAISGDGRYAAILAATSTTHIVLLSTWNLEGCDGVAIGVTSSLVSQGQEELSSDTQLFRPVACTRIAILVARHPPYLNESDFEISISHDGSQVALMERDVGAYGREDSQSAFTVYHHRQESTQAQNSTSSGFTTILQPSIKHQHCDGLRNYFGRGKFHITDTRNVDTKKELFIACDKDQVQIYSVHGKWEHLHTISLRSYTLSWSLFAEMQGRYFVMGETEGGVVPVWDMEFMSVTSVVVRPIDKVEGSDIVVGLSSIGDIVAICWGQRITTHWTATGMMLGSVNLPSEDYAVTGLQYIQGDSKILVATKSEDNAIASRHCGLILETSCMAFVDKLLIPPEPIVQHGPVTGNGTNLYSVHGTTLDLIRLEDCIIQSNSQQATTCTVHCLMDVGSISEDLVATPEHPLEAITQSDLLVRIELSPMPRVDKRQHYRIVVTMSSNDRTMTKDFNIPHWPWQKVFLLDKTMDLIVASPSLTSIWRLPGSMDDDLTLDLLEWHQDYYRWRICDHRELYRSREKYSEDKGFETIQEYVLPGSGRNHFGGKDLKALKEEVMHFLNIFGQSEGSCKKALLRYISPHVNSHLDPDHPSDSLLATLCRWWTSDYQDVHKQFLSELLALSDTIWTLRPDAIVESNPLWIVLDAAQKEPHIMDLANILSNYCLHQAKVRKDIGFLFPVLQCRHASVNLDGLHQKLASFLVKDHSSAPDQHVIGHPPKFCWQFWKLDTRPLLENQGPTVHTFLREIFLAAFSLLWHYKGDTITQFGRLSRLFASPPPWIRKGGAGMVIGMVIGIIIGMAIGTVFAFTILCLPHSCQTVHCTKFPMLYIGALLSTFSFMVSTVPCPGVVIYLDNNDLFSNIVVRVGYNLLPFYSKKGRYGSINGDDPDPMHRAFLVLAFLFFLSIVILIFNLLIVSRGASVIASSNSHSNPNFNLNSHSNPNSHFNSNTHSNSSINSNINSSSSPDPDPSPNPGLSLSSDPSSSSSPIIQHQQEARVVLKTREELQQEQSLVIEELALAWRIAMENPPTENALPEDQFHEQLQELLLAAEIQNAALTMQPVDQLSILVDQVQELRMMMLMMLDAKGAAASSS